MKEYILINFVNDKPEIINHCRCNGLREARKIFKNTTSSEHYRNKCFIYEFKGNNFKELLEGLEK